jgi:hypothetical protein
LRVGAGEDGREGGLNKPVYVLCDAGGSSVLLAGISVFDRDVTLPAIFLNEEDALEVLYEIEKRELAKRPLEIRKLNGALA